MRVYKIFNTRQRNFSEGRKMMKKRIIGLLAVVIVIAALSIWGYLRSQRPPVDIPDNIIDPETPVVPEASLELVTTSDKENLSFNMLGIEDGDKNSIRYRVKATYNSSFTLKYDMTIRESEQFKRLAEILCVKVEVLGKDASVLYEGKLSEMPTLEIPLNASKVTVTEYIFRVTAYLDTPLESGYYDLRLMADMSWWIDEQDYVSVANNKFATVSDPTGPIIPPTVTPELMFTTVNTGDNSPFNIRDMEDGDSQTRYFAFDVIHGDDITVRIKSGVVIDTSLGNVLRAKLELIGDGESATLYEGLLKNLTAEHTLAANDDNSTRVYYKLTVTAVGLSEDYCEKRLTCDLAWSLADTSEQLKVSNNIFVGYDLPTPPTPPTVTTGLSFTTVNTGDNTAFNMADIEDGDSQTRYFAFNVTHGENVSLRIRSSVTADTSLGNVLQAKLELIGEGGSTTLYDGLLKNLNVEHTLEKNDNNATRVYYKLTVTAVGLTEEYCEKSLKCNLLWSIVGTSKQQMVSNNIFVGYDLPAPPAPPTVTPDLSFATISSGDNTAFYMWDIEDGDSQTRYFGLDAIHGSNINIRIKSGVINDTSLGSVLHAKLELVGDDESATLFDGLLKDLLAEHTLEANDGNATRVYYKLTVTAVGLTEDYFETRLTCNLYWSLVGTSEQVKISNNTFIARDLPDEPDEPDIPTPPTISPDLSFTTVNTGDNTAFYMWDIEDGDSQTRYFGLDAIHGGDITIRIRSSVITDTTLGNVLRAKLELVGEDGSTTLFDGLLKHLLAEHTLPGNDNNATRVYYKLTVTANGLTEDYFETRLTCNLYWSLVGTSEQVKISNNTFIARDLPDEPDEPTPPDEPDEPDPPSPPTVTPEIWFITVNPGDNTSFYMWNIEDGDSLSMYYSFDVIHGSDIAISITNSVITDTSLGNVLRAKLELVEESGNVTLYDGLLKNLTAEHTLPGNDNNTSRAYYKLTVTADGLTEDYCETYLTCDLFWSLVGTSEAISVPSNIFVAYDRPEEPDEPDIPTPPSPPTVTPDLSFATISSSYNTPFYMWDVDNGDSQVRYFAFDVTHGESITLRVRSSTVANTALGSVLKVRLELVRAGGNLTLYNGLLKNLYVDHTILANANNSTRVYFKLTVTASGMTSYYYNTRYTCKLLWSLVGTSEQLTVNNNIFIASDPPYNPGEPDDPNPPTPPIDPDDPDNPPSPPIDPDEPDNPDPPSPPAVEPSLDFVTINPGDNTSFGMTDIQNNDSQTKYYSFEVTHGETVALKIKNDIVTNSILGDVLWARVELAGMARSTNVLYDGLLKNLNAEHVLLKNDENKTTVYYKITIYAVGMTVEYSGAQFVCNISWTIGNTEERVSISSNRFVAHTYPGTPDNPDPPNPPSPPAVRPTLGFTTINPGDNTNFGMTGIQNGDSETKYFAFEVTHGESMTVSIKNTIAVDSILSDVLWVRIEFLNSTGEYTIIYEGLLKDLDTEHTLEQNSDNKTNAYYKVTIYSDGLTEEYCDNRLVCDISWKLGDSDEELKVSNHTFVSYPKPAPPPPPVIQPEISFGPSADGDNTAADKDEIMDGFSWTGYFSFEITHSEEVRLNINSHVLLDTGLGSVLYAKLELIGEDESTTTLYDGLLKNLSTGHTLPQNDENKTTVYYKLTVTAVGLTVEHCKSKFICDLVWTIEGTDEEIRVPANSFEGYEEPPTPPEEPETATEIKLTAKDGYDNITFDVSDMLPGDSVSQYYCVSVTHKQDEVVTFFVLLDTEQKLSDVMRIRIDLLLPDAADVVLYDGLMKDCSDVDVTVTASEKTVSAIYYRITVYTNGSEVGNEYVGEALTADFIWQVR